MKKIFYMGLALILSFTHYSYADTSPSKSSSVSKNSTDKKPERPKNISKKSTKNNEKSEQKQTINTKTEESKKTQTTQEIKSELINKSTVENKTLSPGKNAVPVATAALTSPPANTLASPPAVAKPNLPVDCLYQMNAASVSEDELALWAQYAATKSFDYSFDKLDTQLQTLKSCFTEKGWIGFNDALRQSGNLNIIKSQQLIVSSQISGKSEVNLVKPNQWRITVPLQVVYQNTTEKMTQSLAVLMVVTKKTSKELGIVQLIATPVPEQNAVKS